MGDIVALDPKQKNVIPAALANLLPAAGPPTADGIPPEIAAAIADAQPSLTLPKADPATIPLPAGESGPPAPVPEKILSAMPDVPKTVAPPAPVMSAMGGPQTEMKSLAANPLSHSVPTVKAAPRTFGEKLALALNIAGDVGGAMEAAGNRGNAPGAERLLQSRKDAATQSAAQRKLDIEQQQADTNEGYRTALQSQYDLRDAEMPDPSDPAKTIPIKIQNKDMGRYAGAQVGAAAKISTSRYKAVPGVGLFDTQTRQMVPGTSQGVIITPEIAQQYDIPKEFINKPIKLTELAGMENAQSRSVMPVGGATDQYSFNKRKGTVAPLGIGNPGAGVRQAGVTDVMGDDGSPTPMTDAQRLAAGKAKVGSELAVGKVENKIFEPAVDADTRLKQMYQQATDRTGASDQALLFNHIAMTGGAVKGLRMGEYLTEAHRSARGIPEDLGVMWNHLAAGESLSPQQRVNFVRLGEQVRQSRWDAARRQAALAGINNEPPADDSLPELNSISHTAKVPVNTPRGGASPTQPNRSPKSSPKKGDPLGIL